MSNEFKKNDTADNKPIMHLIDAHFKEELAMLLTLGAAKYEAENWRKAKRGDILRYRDALERHLVQRDKGEFIDKDTGLPHTVCIAFNAMALHYFDLKFSKDDGKRVQYLKQLKYYKGLKDGI